MEKTFSVIKGNIRKLDTQKDLAEVADLIQMSFEPYLDEDGHKYLRQIRQAARNPWLVRWTRVAGELVSYPLNGYVWEEDGKIVGNLSLIPFSWHQKWIYLIANVAVHPDYRRQGIARELTIRSLQHLRSRSIESVWLHVRQDNEVAHHLYQTLDFQERCRRDTWQNKELPENLDNPTGTQVAPRQRRDWEKQQQWLGDAYPPEVAWNLGFDRSRFAPGWLSSLNLLFKGQKLVHWAARQEHKLIGVASWERSFQAVDILWLALQAGTEEYALPALLKKMRRKISYHRPIIVNFPAGRAREAFSASGFELLNTLIWMEITLDISRSAGHLTL